ncbi:unnamed protein product [Hymenolepis diminuta]|uniref:Uncharacterized protein n=1 Tax=Hymenolepis diminuta TaxID=6216 RepID=A0A564YZX1_HYMDI|nr:unnamed protein product [Hymenolepis diminuta]
MTHDPYLPCLAPPIDFPPLFYNSLASYKKHMFAHVLTRPYPSDSIKTILVFHTARACHLPAPTLPTYLPFPQHAPLSISLSLVSNSLWLL